MGTNFEQRKNDMTPDVWISDRPELREFQIPSEWNLLALMSKEKPTGPSRSERPHPSLPSLTFNFNDTGEAKRTLESRPDSIRSERLLPKDLQPMAAILAGKPAELKEMFDKFRKDGNTDAEGELIKSILATTGIKVSYNGKSLELYGKLTRNTSDFEEGVGITIDENGDQTAWTYSASSGKDQRQPEADLKKVVKQIIQVAQDNYIEYIEKSKKK